MFCRTCKKDKDVDLFYKSNPTRCKECRKKYDSEYLSRSTSKKLRNDREKVGRQRQLKTARIKKRDNIAIKLISTRYVKNIFRSKGIYNPSVEDIISKKRELAIKRILKVLKLIK